jgi:hypothetical protein
MRRAFAILLFAACSANAWQPGTGNPNAVDGLAVDTSSRRDVLSFYQCVYQASENYAANLGWTGSIAGGSAGTTTAAFKDDVRRRINFYRAMAGQPADVVFNATKSAKCQKAALMMSANNDLDHYPASNWTFYTADGYEAAGASNLALGTYGPTAMDGYMRDDGTGNQIVGHRRWILYSRAQEMGTGDVPASGSFLSSNVLWVIGNFKTAPPAKFIAWPNEGYVPDSLVPARWSLSYPGANFASATVTMTRNSANVPLTIVSRTDNGYGDNTIVWQPTGVPASVTSDTPYIVTVSGISGTGIPTSKTYTVNLFNPGILGDSVTVTGTDSPPTSGQEYTFNPIEQADSYQLDVAALSTETWTEGAEDAPAPRITESISAGYNLRQAGLKRTGAKAFQLAYPSGVFSDQAFTITRDLIPGATSQLQYYDRARWSAKTTTLQTQVSTDGGSTWTSVASRTGVSVTGYSTEWDANWIARNVSLAAYAGQVIHLRFIMKRNAGSVYPGVSADYGFFIDDVTVTNATQLAGSTITNLAGNATSFTLDSTSAGAALVEGRSYILRIRPNVGCHWFGFGAMKTVTAVAPPPPPPTPTFTTWAVALETAHSLPAGTISDANGDADHDGRSNLIEYAFGTSPVSGNDPSTNLPAHSISETHLILEYRRDTTLSDLAFTAQACPTMGNWKSPGDPGAPEGFTDESVSTEGVIETRQAKIPRNAGNCFLRIRVTR